MTEENDVPVGNGENGDDLATHEDESALEARVRELTEENLDLKDKYLRKHADFENYRKRAIKERTDALQYANADIISELLDVLDNFERAERAAIEAKDMEAVKSGLDLIHKNFIAVLTAKGLAKIESVGKEFDPSIHQALDVEESDDVTTPTVVAEYQAGYKLFDRVLRSGRVKVANPSKKEVDTSVERPE